MYHNVDFFKFLDNIKDLDILNFKSSLYLISKLDNAPSSDNLLYMRVVYSPHHIKTIEHYCSYYLSDDELQTVSSDLSEYLKQLICSQIQGIDMLDKNFYDQICILYGQETVDSTFNFFLYLVRTSQLEYLEQTQSLHDNVLTVQLDLFCTSQCVITVRKTP